MSVPASDPLAGSDWYVRVFDFTTVLIEERESEVVAVLLQHPCGARLLLRRAATPLAALRGYPLFGLTVANHAELLRHRQVIWECLWRSRCEWTGWQKMVADCVFQAAATVMIWFQTAKRLVISVRHSGALIR